MSIIKLLTSLLACLFVIVPEVAFTAEFCCTAEDADIKEIRQDDLGSADLADAIATSLKFLRRQPSSRVYRFCDREYGIQELTDTLTDFLVFIDQNFQGAEFKNKFNERFKILTAAGLKDTSKVLVTGYFEPLLEGSLVKDPPFIYPLYKKPADLIKRDGQAGRLQGDRILPYWSRAQIENNGVLNGSELVFLNDPVESFILHIQGSGRVRLRDGRIRRVQFAAKNGLPYRSIGKLLVDRGKMKLAEVTLPSIISYLKAHPEQRDNIFHYNQSFVFFGWGKDINEGPLGCLGEPLTAGRSVALDHNCFPPGALGFLKTRKPIFDGADKIIGWAPLQRFVVNQDCGSAIIGERRVDLFLGPDIQARTTAGLMKHPGKLYFLVKKK